MSSIIDSHCHLDRYDDVNSVLDRARAAGVTGFLAISTSPRNFDKVMPIAEAHPDVYAAAGVHPCDVNDVSESTLYDWLVHCTQHPKVVALGETGLDGLDRSPDRQRQKDIFRIHIQAAMDTDHPLVVHTRNTDEDFLSVMTPYMHGAGPKPKGVLHCFTGGLACAEQAIQWGWKVSMSGIVTFKNAASVQHMARHLPLSSLLVETDAPWLAPDPHRGQVNEPAHIVHTVRHLATLKACSAQDIAQATTQSFVDLFPKARDIIHHTQHGGT